MAFATVAELEDWLGYSLDAGETDRASLLLDVASATIQTHTGQTLELVTDDVADLRGTWERVLTLPERPVVSVASVVLDGETLTVDDDFVVVGDQLRRPGFQTLSPQSDFYPKSGWGGPDVVVRVTYTHGFAVIPDDVKGVCLSLAARLWSGSAGLAMEVLGSYTVQYRRVELEDWERAVLNRYRRRTMSASVF